MQIDQLYIRNSDPTLFEKDQANTNCGSFALNVTEWYTPYLIDNDTSIDDGNLSYYTEMDRNDWAYELVQDGYSVQEVMEFLIEKDWEFILKSCPWLIPIHKEEIVPTDRVIAYRLSLELPDKLSEFDLEENGDFHFRVMIDGEWWEKNGGGPIHKVEEMNEEPWEAEKWLVYTGPIKYAKFREEQL